MLAEERHARIVELVEAKGTASVAELAEVLETSESTIRRDLVQLDQAHRLAKVHGGATSLSLASVSRDVSVSDRYSLNADAKARVGAYAATFIEADDFVYVDAGTATEAMVDAIEPGSAAARASYVTNSFAHARKLAAKGCRVMVLGGEFKADTEALVGAGALDALTRYHFTCGFFGANAIDVEAGLTTPDPNEALVKRLALSRSSRAFVLADASKLGAVGPVTFAAIDVATILVDGPVGERFQELDNLVEVDR